MSNKSSQKDSEDKIASFLAKVLNITTEQFMSFAQPSTQPENVPADKVAKMSGVMALKNEPEFYADAPWRLEPDQDSLPVTFYIRDANIKSPGYSPWRLDSLVLEQYLEQQGWHKLATISPPVTPGINPQGDIDRDFWVYSIQIPVKEIRNWAPGDSLRIRAKFVGSPYPYETTQTIERYLEVFLARDPLPLGRASTSQGARQWFYGDTHYHSAYTNDIKEYGAPIPETRAAGQAVGLDWLVVTDHSTDLDEIDAGYGGQSRWERLKTELSNPDISDDQFRFILGEEITLIGRNNGFVHMLAIGNMDQMIEGAFLPESGHSVVTDLCRQAIEGILKNKPGYHPRLLKQLFGKIFSFEDVLQMLPVQTLTFAAHPGTVAQVIPPKWDNQDLAHPQLTGLEFWNGRSRKKALHTGDPFYEPGWTDPEELISHDNTRIKGLINFANNKWDPHLQRGVKEWGPDVLLPSRRPVFIAGTDAHGDFNYHVGMALDYTKVGMIDDNAIGKVRTVIFLPDHPSAAVPGVDEILATLKKGCCVVTDGPIIEFHLENDGQIAHMGDALIVTGDGEPVMKIIVHSTPEFGPVTQVEVVTYFKGQKPKKPSIAVIERDKPVKLDLAGAQGYIRLQAQSVGPEGERFCCFTNPIWIRCQDYFKQTMHIDFP